MSYNFRNEMIVSEFQQTILYKYKIAENVYFFDC